MHLRTVIVTGRRLLGLQFVPSRLRQLSTRSLPAPGRRQPRHLTIFAETCVLNSRLGLFTAAPLSPSATSPCYGVILPSSLTRVHSTHLDALLDYLCRFAVRAGKTFGFSRRRDITDFPTLFRSSWHLSLKEPSI